MSRIEKQLDLLWQRAIKARDNHKCQLCYTAGTDGHHLIIRRHKATRWLIENGICVCRECHRFIHDGKIKLRISDELIILSRQITKFSTDDLHAIKDSLNEYIKKVEAKNG